MNAAESAAVIAALARGRQFEFSSYWAGTREVLEYERAAGCFALTGYDAWDPDATRRTEFTREEIDAYLQGRFSFESFGLPPVA